MNLLSEDVVLWTDGGGKAKTAAFRPVIGRDAVARFSMGTKRFWPPDYHTEQAEVNGQLAMLIYFGDQLFSVLTIEVEGEKIRAVRVSLQGATSKTLLFSNGPRNREMTSIIKLRNRR